jgi:hypothetical protein
MASQRLPRELDDGIPDIRSQHQRLAYQVEEIRRLD